MVSRSTCRRPHRGGTTHQPQDKSRLPAAGRSSRRCIASLARAARSLRRECKAAWFRDRLAVVLIEEERPISPRINRDSQRLVDPLAGVLLHWPERQDRSGANVKRHGFEIDFAANLPASLVALARPEIVPGAAAWQIYLTRRGSLLDYRRDQYVRPPQVFIAARHCRGIVRIMQPQSAHHRHSRHCAFPDGAV